MSESQELGRLRALRKAKRWKQDPLEWLEGFVEKHSSEIPEWVALGTTTVLVHSVIKTTPNLLNKAGELWDSFLQTGSPILWEEWLKGGSAPWVAEQVTTFRNSEAFQWGISFAIAWILVKHGANVMGLAGVGLVALIGMFLGV